MNLDELECPTMPLIDQMVRSLHQRTFAHAARTPQKRVVGREALREALGILDEDIARKVDSLEEADIYAVDPGYGLEASLCRMPYESGGGSRIDNDRSGRSKAVQRSCDTFETGN